MTKKNELVINETSTEVAAYNASDWGDIGLETKDLVLPRILIQQATSEAVKTKKASDGDLLNTLTDEVLGTSVEVLPFFKRESIVIEKWNGKKFEFLKIVPYEGKQKPFEEEIGGVRYKNSHMYEIFCLTKDMGLPHIIPFKGTSNKIGRNLLTMMYAQNIAEKLSPAGKWINYHTKQESNKDGDLYYVSAFAPTKRSSNTEVAECLKWIKVLKESNFQAAEEAQVSHEAPFETTRF
jgi:hypothetical protein